MSAEPSCLWKRDQDLTAQPWHGMTAQLCMGNHPVKSPSLHKTNSAHTQRGLTDAMGALRREKLQQPPGNRRVLRGPDVLNASARHALTLLHNNM